MAILNEKPFNPESGFRSRIFKGAPAYYAKPDLQQYFDSLEYNLSKLNKLVLGDVTGSVLLHEDSTWNVDKSQYNLRLAVTDPFVVEIGKHKVPFEGIPLDYNDALVFNGNTIEQDDEPDDFPGILASQITNVILLAKERTITFSEDPEKGGIFGPGIAAPLESSDVVEYYDFSLSVYKGGVIPETLEGKTVLYVLAQFTFYYENYWKPILIQNFRTDHTNMDPVTSRFPLLNKWLSPFGKFDWLFQVVGALNSRAILTDGTKDATADLFVDKGVDGRFRIITTQDYANTTAAGIVKLATAEEAVDVNNNTVALTPYSLQIALGSTKKIYPIGSWDMDNEDTVTFAHGLAEKWIKAVPTGCSIYNDAGDIIYDFFSASGSEIVIDNTSIILTRAGGIFDNVAFSDDDLENRGYVIIELVGLTEPIPLAAPDVDAGADSPLTLAGAYVDLSITGSITAFTGSIVAKGWSVVSGSTTNVALYVGSDPAFTTFRFNAVGTWVLKFFATASDGTNTATGYDTREVVVTAVPVPAPMTYFKHDDNTSTLKNYSIIGSGNITLVWSVTDIPVPDITNWEFEYQSENGTGIYGPWTAANFTPSGVWNKVLFYVDSAMGSVRWRVRVFTVATGWLPYSNILQGQITYAPLPVSWTSPDVSTPVSTGPIVGPSDYDPGASAIYLDTFLVFKASGVLVNPAFTFRVTSTTVYLEYDPYNVQTKPADISNYDVSGNTATTIVVTDNSLKDADGNPTNVWSGITGSFDCESPAGRLRLKQYIRAWLYNFGKANKISPYFMETNYRSGNYEVVATDDWSGLLEVPDYQETSGKWVITQPLYPMRGTGVANRTLVTTSSPTLAKRVYVSFGTSDFS